MTAKKRKMAYAYFSLLLVSIMVTVWAGARSGLAASVLAMGVMLMLIAKSVNCSTMFEGYLFQAGWYLCIVLRLTVSILDDYKKYGTMEFNDYYYF